MEAQTKKATSAKSMETAREAGYFGKKLIKNAHKAHLEGRPGGVRRPPNQQVEKRASQAVDIDSKVDRADVRGLLRGHILGRAHHLATIPHLIAARVGRPELGETQVEDFHLALPVHD